MSRRFIEPIPSKQYSTVNSTDDRNIVMFYAKRWLEASTASLGAVSPCSELGIAPLVHEAAPFVGHDGNDHNLLPKGRPFIMR